MALQPQDLEDSLKAFMMMLDDSEAVAEAQRIRNTAQHLFDHHTDTMKTITQYHNGK